MKREILKRLEAELNILDSSSMPSNFEDRLKSIGGELSTTQQEIAELVMCIQWLKNLKEPN